MQVEAISRALQDKHNMLLQSKGSLADDLSKLKVCTIDEYQVCIVFHMTHHPTLIKHSLLES